MEPTIAEIVFWLAFDVGCVLLLLAGCVINPYYDPKGDDPYRFCPKINQNNT